MEVYALISGKYTASVFPVKDIDKHKFNLGNQRIYTFAARDWEDAMTRYHEHMGFEPYVPFDKR